MTILQTIIAGILGFFIQPLLYVMLFFAMMIALQRVWQERQMFHVRTYSVLSEWLAMLKPAFIFGLLGSAVFVAFGIVLPEGMIVLIAVCYILSLLFLSTRFVSPIFTVGAAVLIAFFIPSLSTGFTLLDRWLTDVSQVSFFVVVAMLGLLLVIEAELIRLWGVKRLSPKRLQGHRGKVVGGLEAKRFWLIPLFVLIPTGTLASQHGWPLLLQGPEGFSLLLVPFGFGFYHLAVHERPEHVYMNHALLDMALGVALLVSAIIGWYVGYTVIPIIVTILAFCLRLVVEFARGWRRKHGQMFNYAPHDEGLVVLSVLPKSPAEKMAIVSGERIYRVNGHMLQKQADVYHALQDNAAFCRLEVIDQAGEKRIVQSALYEGSHHELGMLFV